MGTASAKPGNLQAFVDAAAEIRGELADRITTLRASYDAFQRSGSSYVGNADLMEAELPGFVGRLAEDEAFVSIVRQAFLDADATVTGDGRVVVDAAAFSSAFDAAATAAGFDPAALMADRPAVTVDVPVAAGTPRTSGWVNDPVCTATGHFMEAEDDFTWPDRLALLRWRRTYSSRFVAGGPFGRGWASWASVGLLPGDDGSVGYQGTDGQLAVFVPSLAVEDPGGYGRVPGVAATLVRVPGGDGADDAGDQVPGDGGGWELRWDRHADTPHAVWAFDAGGRVRTVSSPVTGTVRFTYTGGLLTALAHEGGRSLALEWDGPRIVAVRSSCGRAATYRYDDAGDLVAVDRVLGARRYVTDGEGRVVEVWDADGVRLCRNAYDPEGRVTAQVSPFGRETTLTYQPGNRTVVSDTEGGPVSVYEHDRVGRLVGLVDHHGHRLARRFDAEGRCVEATGFDGAVLRQDVAADGRSATRTGPGGVDERWTYDEHGRVTAHQVDGGPELAFAYDGEGTVPARISGPDGWEVRVEAAEGLVTGLTDADGVGVRFAHDADGTVVATSNGLGAATTTEPHVSGLPSRVTYPDGAVYEVDRDDAGRMLTLRTPLGDEYTVEWTAAGRLAGMVGPDEAHTSFEHGQHGGVERVVDALGATLELSHDHLERLVGLAAPGGAKWEFSYSATGMLSLVHDPAGGTWGYDYDPAGRLVAATNPRGDRVRQRYDGAGRLAEVVDPTGNATRYTRDALGRVVAEDGPEGANRTYEWDAWGRPTLVRLPDGDTLAYAYSPAGRVRTVTTGEGRTWANDYDTAGRLVATTDPTGAVTRYTWDACDRPVATTTPEGRTVSRSYDLAGRVVAVTRGDRTWRFDHDHAGRVTAATDPLGATRTYRYDLRGKLVAAADALGNAVRLRYDERGDAVAVLDPFGGAVTTTYDAMRRPVAVTDQLGRTTRIGRDAAGRVVRRELPTGEIVEWRRDARGLVTDVRVGGRDVVVFDRDGAGRPVLVHEPARNRTFTFGWSRGGRLDSLDVDGAAVRWRRDGDGLVVGRVDAAGRGVAYSRDAAGRLAGATSDRWGTVEIDRDLDGRLVALRADGLSRRWDRDAAGVVVGYRASGPEGLQGPGGARVTRIVRDAAGRVVQVHGDGGMGVTAGERYGYDAAGQLVSALTPAGAWTFAYDAAGRLVAEEGPDGPTSYTYDEAHQLVAVAGPSGTTAFAYDAAGRRTDEVGPTGTRRFRWDGLGRLTEVAGADGRAHTLDVDALGHLAGYGDHRFAWDHTGPAPELAAIDEREVVAVAGQIVGTAAAALDPAAADWRGSLGPAHASRDPWGAVLPAPAAGDGAGDREPGGVGLGFLGELELDGLTWLRHRVYDPATRQLLSPDPLPGVPGSPAATHRYHYAGNDPVSFADPLGLEPLSIDQYNEIRAQETGWQWDNIGTLAMGGLMVASFFVPGGPIVATLVGVGLGMAPGVIQGVTTGDWDAGAIIEGGIVGGVTGRLGFAFGGSSASLSTAFLRGGGGGFASGVVTEGYDMLPLPGSDGQFDLENVAVETVIGTATGGMGHRFDPGGGAAPVHHETTTPVDLHAFGNRTAPRPPRPSPDMEVVDGVFVGQQPPLPHGASTFADPNEAGLTGQYHRLPGGTELPDGFAVVADGSDVVPGSPHPPTHHTVYPTRDMAPEEFTQGFNDLPWEHAGKIK
jgi:RHS repeat-associated protein